MVHEISLTGYSAIYTGKKGRLVLGTAGSYGIEKLHLVYGVGWEGRTVSAIFTIGGATVVVLADSDGSVQVPPEATAVSGTGAITILGVDETSQRISVDVPYLVMAHADVQGDAPDPTPDEWQQYVAAVKQYADQAQKAADKIPTPTPADEGKSVVARADGTYGLALIQGGGGGVGYNIGHGLKVTGGNTLEVDTAEAVEQDNTLPVTSAAVYTEVGNIDALLQTI